jgi:hypothetical protein
MVVVKYILLFAVVGLTLWLIVDTSITIVKKIKARKSAKKQEEDSKTE